MMPSYQSHVSDDGRRFRHAGYGAFARVPLSASSGGGDVRARLRRTSSTGRCRRSGNCVKSHAKKKRTGFRFVVQVTTRDRWPSKTLGVVPSHTRPQHSFEVRF